VGIVSGLDVTPVSVGSRPQALGTLSGVRTNVLLVADSAQQRLLQVRLSDNSVLTQSAALDGSPSHVWVEGSTVYVVNASSNTLQILQPSPLDAGIGPDGLPLVTVGRFNFGADTSPQAMVKVGTSLYVVLRGTDANPGAGQRVVQLDVRDPTNPGAGLAFDLSGLDLRPFDGGTAIARPTGIAAFGNAGILYVALNNLRPLPNPDPAGPGVLAKIDIDAGTISRVDLPADACINAQWLVPTSDTLYVGCGGAATFDGGNPMDGGGVPISTDRTGIVALNTQDQRIATWSASCPSSGTDAGCIPPSVRRFAAFGSRLYIGDQYGGRVFVVEKVGNQLDAGLPILACPPSGGGASTVSDVIVP
jgi:hypothetical protein